MSQKFRQLREKYARCVETTNQNILLCSHENNYRAKRSRAYLS